MATKRILVVDDEENIGRSLRMILEREGYAVSIRRSMAEFRALPEPRAPTLSARRAPAGRQWHRSAARPCKQTTSTAPIIMISGHGTIADAVEATRAGAFDFLEKPLGRDRVLLALKNALEQSSLQQENERLRELVGRRAADDRASPRLGGAPWNRPAWPRAPMRASCWSANPAPGKELLAAHIHRSSPFAAGPFVKVNCAAIPSELIESELFGHEKGAFTGATSARRGKFELADGGTIFLDEMGDLHGASQAKLLRVLQEGEFHRVGGEQTIKVTVRVISATNRDLAGDGRAGKIPRRSLLSAERGADPRARAARASAGHPAAGRILPGGFLRPQQFQAEELAIPIYAHARSLQLAGQRP